MRGYCEFSGAKQNKNLNPNVPLVDIPFPSGLKAIEKEGPSGQQVE